MDNTLLLKEMPHLTRDIKKILSKCVELEKELQKLVDENTFSLITKALEHQSDMMEVEVECAFVEGFSLAVSLLLEALSEK